MPVPDGMTAREYADFIQSRVTVPTRSAEDAHAASSLPTAVNPVVAGDLLWSRVAGHATGWGVDSGGGSQPVLKQDFAFTAAQVKASNNKTFVAAAGAGTVLVPVGGVLVYTFVTTPFAAGDIRMRVGPYDFVSQSGVLNQSDSQVVVLAPQEAGADLDEVTNVPIVFLTGLPGAVSASSLNDGGSSYAVGDTGTLDGGDNNATYIVTAQAAGVVTGYTITGAGTNYATTAVSTTPGGAQPGVGTGLAITITSVNPSGSAGDGTVSGSIIYFVQAV